MLKKIAWILLSIIHLIDLENGKFTTCDIEAAANNHEAVRHTCKARQLSQHSRQLFFRIAIKWLHSIGRFVPPREVEIPFSDQLSFFARYLREERGLSPVTISTRCERLV